MLSVGLNIVVGYAGLLDLGYVAFYGMGAYAGVLFGFVVQDWLRSLSFLGDKADGFTFWLMLPVAALAGAITGLALGTPVLRLRGDYLAIVTLGFGEIVRIFLTNYSKLTSSSPRTSSGTT
jgi:branched-chain amino acid transport system permease protein